MFKCHVCGSTEAREDFVNEVFAIGDRRVLVEHIPAQICGRCGEATFSRATTEKVRRLHQLRECQKQHRCHSFRHLRRRRNI